MNSKVNKILILAPHTDDGEFGAGGSIAKWIEFGHEIYYVAFSFCLIAPGREPDPSHMCSSAPSSEAKAAMEILGISLKNVTLLNYPVRNFPVFRQQILDEMIRLRDEIKPDVIVLPSDADTHQDHITIFYEGFRAFKRSSIVGYEIPYNNKQFNANLFIPLSQEHVDHKIEAIKCYKSQFGRIQDTPDFIRSLAVMRGAQIGVKYAEAFSVARWIL